MGEARTAVVTGTVVHAGRHVVIVPSTPPPPTGLPKDERLRAMFLALPPDPDDADQSSSTGTAGTAGTETMVDVHRRFAWVVELHGTDLPADGDRAQVRGELTGRSLRVDDWRPEPLATSAWGDPDVEGTDLETAGEIVHGVPGDWPLVSVGVSRTATGGHAVVLEVDHLTPEIQTWFDGQPSGSVQLHTFVLQPARPST